MKRIFCFLLSIVLALALFAGFFSAVEALSAPINLSASPESASGEGWSWNGARKMLYLSGVSLSVSGEAAIVLPAGAGITYSGVNSVYSNGDAIVCAGGFLYVRAQTDADSLNVQAGGTGIVCADIVLCGNNLTVHGARAASGFLEAESGYSLLVGDSGALSQAPYFGQPEVRIGILYPVTIRVGTGGGASFYMQNFAPGTTVEIEARPKTGFALNAWSSMNVVFADAESAKTTFIMPAAPVNIYGAFDRVYHVTVAEVEGGYVEHHTEGEYFTPGRQVILYAIPYSGYYFAGWSSDYGAFRDRLQAYTALTMPSVDTVVTPIFLPGDSYSLKISQIGEGTLNVRTGNFPEKQRVFLSAVPAEGYVFSGWVSTSGTFTSSSSPTTYFRMPSENTEIKAIFAATDEAKCVLTVTKKTGGSVNIEGGAFVPGTPVQLVATAKTGYRFIKWTIVQENFASSFVNLNAPETEFMMPVEPVEIAAVFELLDPDAVQFYCAVGTTEGGTVSGEATGYYIAGYEMDLVATPAEGYVFSGWRSALGGSFLNAADPVTVFTVPANDTKVFALFAKEGAQNPLPGGTTITPISPESNEGASPSSGALPVSVLAGIFVGLLAFGFLYAGAYSKRETGAFLGLYKKTLRSFSRRKRTGRKFRARRLTN